MVAMIMTNWKVREFGVKVKLPYSTWQAWLPIWQIRSPIQDVLNPMRSDIPKVFHIESHSHISFSSSPTSHSSCSATVLLQDNTISAKQKSVQKLNANLPDCLVDLTSTPKSFQLLPDPSGAEQSAIRLCNSIFKYYRKHLQLWRCIQDATIFDL